MPRRQAIIRNHPQTIGLDTRVLEQGITACLDCAVTLRSCADINLTRADAASRRYLVRSLLDGADVCQATARLLLRQTAPGLQPLRGQRRHRQQGRWVTSTNRGEPATYLDAVRRS